jgi:hypothetical protein
MWPTVSGRCSLFRVTVSRCLMANHPHADPEGGAGTAAYRPRLRHHRPRRPGGQRTVCHRAGRGGRWSGTDGQL